MPDSPSCSAVMSLSSCSRGEAFGLDPVLDVGAVEAGDEVLRVLHPQTLGELTVGGFGGRRRQRDPRDVREGVRQHRQTHVVGAEVVAPLGDAVRLVDRDERELGALQQVDGAREHQTLRRHVEQVDLAGQQLLLDGLRLVGSSVEFRKAARIPTASSAATWSDMSAISGETTMPVPFRSSAGIW